LLTRARWGEALTGTQGLKDLSRIGEELLTLAQNNLGTELAAHTLLGGLTVRAGRFAESEKHLRLVLERSDQFPENRLDFPGYGRIDNLAAVLLANVFTIQGFVNEAPTQVADALRRVESADRASYTPVSSFACHVTYLLGDFQSLADLARSVSEVSEKMGFLLWVAHAKAYMGRLALDSGDVKQGLSQIDDALAAMEQPSLILNRERFLTMKAECLLLAGCYHKALEISDEMIATSVSTGIEWNLAEYHRIKGEALLSIDPVSAENQLRTALAIARRQGARLWELRAALSLARLMSATNRAEEARHLLAPICDWFDSAVSLSTLSEARELLAQLPE
jgi:hypothetical protein